MKHFTKIIAVSVFIMFLGLYASSICAQQAISASGGDATGTGGSVSYTVGQVTYTTNKSATGTVTQGVQQPYEILVVTGIEEAGEISLEFIVYPNPTSDFLKLDIENYKLKYLSYQLYDMNGSLLQKKDIVSKETVIPTGDLAPAAYYLRIGDNEKEIKTFKIIKN
jgi:hypothetical protein